MNPISIISHKLRTPMTVIVSTVNNLLDGAFGSLNKDQEKWVRKLGNHTKSLETLLDEVLGLIKDATTHGSDLSQKIMQVGESEHRSSPILATSSPSDGSPTDQVPTILIVDDEPDILDVVQQGMTIKGFKTVTASNGDQAIQLSKETKPDLILMDVLLRDQNGIEICRQIKSQSERFTPVILVTGQDDLRDKITGSDHDADDLLTKPFQMEELFTRVGSMLRMKKLHDQLNSLKIKDNQ